MLTQRTGKVILIFILFSFTFVTMVGGNPSGDAYGFRHWNNPGAFAEYLSSGSLGRFEGFLACMWSAVRCFPCWRQWWSFGKEWREKC
jgi:amino acid transporter